MTDQEKRSLKSYLSNVLEPELKRAKDQQTGYEDELAAAVLARKSLKAHHAGFMKQWAYGKVCAWELAISEFEELFKEDLQPEKDI